MVQHPCLLCILLSNRQRITIICFSDSSNDPNITPSHTDMYISEISRYPSVVSASLFLLLVTFLYHQIRSTLPCSWTDLARLLSSPPLIPHQRTQIKSVWWFSVRRHQQQPLCILSIAVLFFNTGTEAQDRGKDRQKETVSVRE